MNFNLEAFVVPVVMLILGAVSTLLFARRGDRRKGVDEKSKADADLHKRIVELESQLMVVKEKVVPISAAFQAILIKELTHFHTPVMDALLVKLGPPNTLTDAEEKELAAALRQRSKDLNGAISDSERDAAEMLPMVVKRAKAEEHIDLTQQPLQIVAAVEPPAGEGEAKKP